jgi:hypothetical protein
VRLIQGNGACLDCQRPTGKRYAKYCDTDRWRHRGKKRTYRLTPEAEAYLRGHYKPAVNGSAQKCAAVLGVPKWRACKWAAELGLTTGVYRRNSPDWTREQDAFLEKHAGRRHVNWISKQLGRSITAVQVRIKRLSLSRLPDGYGQSEVAQAFGVSRDTVERWHRMGLLRSHFKPLEGQPYRFTDRELLEFIRNHPTAFQLSKVEPVWFLDLVLGEKSALRRIA